MSEYTVRPVRDEELPHLITEITDGYVRQKIELGGIEPEAAAEQGAKEMPRYFPEGRLREGDDLLLLVDEQDVPVGRLWIGSQVPGHAFILDVEVDAARRGQGLGSRLMATAEEWARDHGLHCVDLHVFGGNQGAIALYERLGYEVTDLMMRKGV